MTRFGNLERPLAQSVLYLLDSYLEASPKAISGRTSYFRVRLAFHPYPHLIARLFNDGAFGPPRSLTSASPWTWVDHSVSGLRHETNAPYSDSLSLRLRLISLTSLHNVTRRFILQKARHHSERWDVGSERCDLQLELPRAIPASIPTSHLSNPTSHEALTACKHMVSGSISLPSRGAFHLSLTVLVHYRSLGSI